MADISKITLPSGNTYDIKDAVAREAIASLSGSSYFLGVTTTALTDQATTNPISIDGESITAKNGNIVVYGNAEFVFNGTKWFEFGDLSALGSLAYKSNIAFNKGTGENVLGEGTTFTAADSSVSFSGGSNDKVLGADTTFTVTQPTINVTPATTNIKATASGTVVSADGTATVVTGYAAPTTDTFVKSVSAETNKKLVTTTVPNVTSAGSASTWGFAMGTGTSAETLIISGANGTAPTLGAAKTVATGATDANGTGDSIVTGVTIGSSASAITGLGTASTATALTGVKVTSQPIIALATGATAEAGVVAVTTGISSATATGGAVSANTDDQVTAITGIGTATAAAQVITVGANDKIKIAKFDELSVIVS